MLPLLTQRDYDHLLWACDLNFVRGEDSFVRAQWAGAPFVWQIYPQDDGAHAAQARGLPRPLSATARRPASPRRARCWRRLERLRPGRAPAAPPEPRGGPHCAGWRDSAAGAAGSGDPAARLRRRKTLKLRALRARADHSAVRAAIYASTDARTRKSLMKTRTGNSRRQRHHAGQGPDGRAQDRIQPRRPQRGHRAHEAQEPAQQLGHRSRLQGRRQDGPDHPRQEGVHLLLLRRPDVRVHGRRVQPVRGRGREHGRRDPVPRRRHAGRSGVLRRQGHLGRAADQPSCARSPTPSRPSRATPRARC